MNGNAGYPPKLMQTHTTIWTSGSILDIQKEIADKEMRWESVRQIALTQDPQREGSEPEFTGFIVYERPYDGD